MHDKPNRLIREKSPYLLQHAYNPVDWYPWGEEAFDRARAEDKPIFLSIGYSTCHWCHVMERESFENDSTASILNAYFICIKVDREERPDVDRVYMTALQAMGQNGGWPMSMFLKPDRKPFYGGTYFPPDSRYGRTGFPDVLKKIHEIWIGERSKVDISAQDITAFLEDVASARSDGRPADAGVIDSCFDQLRATYDREAGGFGSGPKFPRPVVLDFLLRYHNRTGKTDALEMVTHTLKQMALGGMYDQIGGGFHRYSVDASWRVPHFEKMLYDQAQLVQAYLGAFQTTGDQFFAAVARETLDYVLRDMTGPEGGFYSAEDADSPRPEADGESGEGAFYIWSKKEIEFALGRDGPLFCFTYGVEDTGNAPFDPQHEFIGRNILYRAHPPEVAAKRFGLSEQEFARKITSAREKLLILRSLRERPLRDDKILTSWNGLMIGSFARASRVLDEPHYLESARRAARFVLSRLRDKSSGELLRRYRDGEARFEAHLVDYAFLVSGLIDLYEASGEPSWLEDAVSLTETLVKRFRDPVRHGFFDTAGEDSTVLVRMKEQYDGAEPTGNSVSAMNLARLSRMIERSEWNTLAQESVSHFGESLRRQPSALPLMVSA
ncbi:MAG TPA: thioredoxin domain-containing protein, partial [Bacteroidota bacterium]|nr:thioredoxin domain-containing protein [Bacteroidota bacterium]